MPNVALRVFAAVLLIQAATLHAADAPLANGVFLVAKPGMADPNFRETVVLITEPEVGGGPVGVIVNRPLDAKLSRIVPGLRDVPKEFDQVYLGGPVAPDHILFLVRTPQRPEHALKVLPDVYLSADRKLAEKIVGGRTTATAFRAYAGSSGWEPDQLQSEIEGGGWYVIPADADTIFSADPSNMWAALIRRATRVMAQLPVEGVRVE
jgi:putative transcriptional regulator